MEEVRDYTNIVPTTPPEGLIQWLYQKGVFNNEYIVYRADWEYEPLEDRKVKVVSCHCTACERDIIQPYVEADCCNKMYAHAPFGFLNELTMECVINGNCTLCPCCGSEVKALHCSNINNHGFYANEIFPISIHNIDGNLGIIEWRVARKIYKHGEVRITTVPCECYIFEEKKAVRITGYDNNMGNISYRGVWKQKKKYTDALNSVYSKMVYPFDPSLLIGTTAENSKLDMYLSCAETVYPVSYMRLWQRYKNVENLVVQGASKLLNDKLKESIISYVGSPRLNDIKGINYKEKKPHLMLGLSKEEFRYAVAENWNSKTLSFYVEAREYGVTLADVDKCMEYGEFSLRRLFPYKVNIMRAIRYIEKQKRKFKRNDGLISAGYYADYLHMAKENGDDLTQDNVCYPHNLQNAHDVAVRLQKVKENEKLKALFEERNKILDKYSYECNGLLIRPAHSERELIDEGKILNHCVATYANSHAYGRTSIFFIRETVNPEQPYYTLELDITNMRVRQNRGKNNCARTDTVRNFEKEWIEHIKGIAEKERRAA